MDFDSSQNHIIAYELASDHGFTIRPLRSNRSGLPDEISRCLPVTIGNQYGWAIHSSKEVRVSWNGNPGQKDIRVNETDHAFFGASSHFGYGIVTWVLPFLFRTSPDYNLLVRGPSNSPKDSIFALEGIVETDWLSTTFTMNWLVTQADREIIFHPDDIVCVVVPIRKNELSAFETIILPIESNAQLTQEFLAWSKSRSDFNDALKSGTIPKDSWQKDYIRGLRSDSSNNFVPQTRLNLREFKRII
jgi:hypothetical protein